MPPYHLDLESYSPKTIFLVFALVLVDPSCTVSTEFRPNENFRCVSSFSWILPRLPFPRSVLALRLSHTSMRDSTQQGNARPVPRRDKQRTVFTLTPTAPTSKPRPMLAREPPPSQRSRYARWEN